MNSNDWSNVIRILAAILESARRFIVPAVSGAAAGSIVNLI